MRRSLTSAILLALTLAAGACGGDATDLATGDGLAGTLPEVHVYDAWVVQDGPSTAEVSLRVHNAGAEDDRLLLATCACDATVTVDGALVVSPEQEVVVRTGGTPGLRLTGLADRLRPGRFLTLTLTFELAGEVTADAEVRRP